MDRETKTHLSWGVAKSSEMIVVVFESEPLPGKAAQYLDMATQLSPLVEHVDGFISVERFESVTNPGKMVALSFWRDEQAARDWHANPEHKKVREQSKHTVFSNYRIRVANVVRDYEMTDR